MKAQLITISLITLLLSICSIHINIAHKLKGKMALENQNQYLTESLKNQPNNRLSQLLK